MNQLCEMIKQFGPLVGRILIAAIFVQAGWGKITGFAGTAAFMASKGMPFTELLLVGAIVVELGGGLLLILGWQARWAAAAIFFFMIPTTLIFHAFWAVEAAQQSMQQIHFMKNVSIMGGLLYIVAYGAGPASLDNRRR